LWKLRNFERIFQKFLQKCGSLSIASFTHSRASSSLLTLLTPMAFANRKMLIIFMDTLELMYIHLPLAGKTLKEIELRKEKRLSDNLCLRRNTTPPIASARPSDPLGLQLVSRTPIRLCRAGD
jgi:hypothetical protein